MTPQELRSSIIQQAIQGKLVSQIASERAAKSHLAQVKARIGNSNAEPISEGDMTLDLPGTWEWVRLSDITTEETLGDGNWVLSKDMVPSGPVKLIQLGNIGNCRYIEKGYKYLTEDRFLEIKGKQIFGGYLLVNRLIGDKMLQCIIPDIEGILITAVDVCWIAPNDDVISQKYLMYVLASPDFQTKVKALGRGTTRFRISKLNLISIAFPFPPLEEQRRIVAKLEEILPLIDRYEAAWNKLEAFNKRFPGDMQKSILQLAIQGKLVEQRPEEGTGEELFQQIHAEKQALIKAGKIKKVKPLPEITEDEIPFEIPDSWKWVRFSELMNSMSTGPFGSMLHKSDYVESGIPLVNPANIVNGRIIPSDKMMVSHDTVQRLESYKLQSGMIVMGRRGEMGRCAVVSDTENGWLCGTGSFFMVPSARMFVYYISMFFNTSYARSYLSGASVGTTMSNLNHKILSSMPVPLPPMAEQKRIVAKLEEILPLCDRLK